MLETYLVKNYMGAKLIKANGLEKLAEILLQANKGHAYEITEVYDTMPESDEKFRTFGRMNGITIEIYSLPTDEGNYNNQETYRIIPLSSVSENVMVDL